MYEYSLLITCEHAGRRVPAAYRELFAPHAALLRTHRGWDLGALAIARVLSRELDAPLHAAAVTRLLVDLNRSVGNPTLHSEVTASLSAAELDQVLEQHYRPHRDRVMAAVAAPIAAGRRVVHIGSHSFTPELDGHVRQADVGFLFDPQRPHEVALSERWLAALQVLRPDLRLRCNYPYQGGSDGLMLALRARHDGDAYLGIELEVNQAIAEVRGPERKRLGSEIASALRTALADDRR